MHGVKRTRITPQAAEAKRIKEQSKIETYVALQADVLSRKKAKEYTQEALGQTTKLLDLNPEFYTIWNYRRNILLHGLFPDSTPEEVVGMLKNELKLTMAYLQIHPKVYWIWNHRKWCLEHVPLGPAAIDDSLVGESEGGSVSTEKEGTLEEMTEGWRCGFWKGELAVIEALLDADPRNFHAWDYRRYVLSSLPSSFAPPRTPAQELAYTRKKIESNFSNFSAWHCRTKVLGGMWEGLDQKQVDEEKDQEFELVTQALWTDPGDQSGWIYHRWLIGTNVFFPLQSHPSLKSGPPDKVLRREINSIQELHDTEPDSKWCMNALANYLILQSNLPSTDKFKATRQREEARSLFGRLEEIDPDRKERYKDLASAC